MRSKVLAAMLAVATWAICSQASAEIVDYYISGDDGTGSINGVPWKGAFLITMVGDNSNVSNDHGVIVEPLEGATVTLPGGVTATLSIATWLGKGGAPALFFGELNSGDLFDFYLSFADFDAFDFQPGFGPAPGDNVYALSGFTNIPTSAGPLTFATSGDVQFSSSAVPEPSTWAMMLIGFAGLGFASCRARGKGAALPA